MKKILFSLFILVVSLVMLTGCTTTKSVTFEVQTGDRVKITLNTSDGYDISTNAPFVISKDGKTLSQGSFIKESYYDQYANIIKKSSTSEIIDSNSDGDIEYIFYSYMNKEFNYIIKLKNSNTAILLGNPNSKEEAMKCFELLKFSLEK